MIFVVGAVSYAVKIFLQNNEKINEFEVFHTAIFLEVGEKIDLDELYVLKTSSSNYTVSFTLSNYECAKISLTNVLTALNVGQTTLTITASTRQEKREKSIEIYVSEKTTIPTDFSFEKSEILLEIGSTLTNKIVCDEEFNAKTNVSYSNENICEYDIVTGKIEAKNIGETQVFVKLSSKNNEISRSFSVVVSKNSIENDENDEKIILNLEKEDNFYVKTVEVDKNFIIIISKPLNEEFLITEESTDAILTLIQCENGKIILYAQKVGTTTLKITLKSNTSISTTVKITVKSNPL